MPIPRFTRPGPIDARIDKSNKKTSTTAPRRARPRLTMKYVSSSRSIVKVLPAVISAKRRGRSNRARLARSGPSSLRAQPCGSGYHVVRSRRHQAIGACHSPVPPSLRGRRRRRRRGCREPRPAARRRRRRGRGTILDRRAPADDDERHARHGHQHRHGGAAEEQQRDRRRRGHQGRVREQHADDARARRRAAARRRRARRVSPARRWHCFVGRNFACYVTYEASSFTYFYIGQVGICLFATD